MKSTFIASGVLVLAALTGASAFAQNSTLNFGQTGYTTSATSNSGLTRSDVKAQYVQARNNGELQMTSNSEVSAAHTAPSMTTRAAVRADAVQMAKAPVADAHAF